jgi:hypothetical protein
MGRYRSPESFRQALEARLQGQRLIRNRQMVVFERFLARASAVLGDSVILKGGLALELRLASARTTKDVDLRVAGHPDRILSWLHEAGRLDLGDFMRFEIKLEHKLEAQGMRYEGYQYRAECRLGGKLFGSAFHVDVAFGEHFVGQLDISNGHDWLDFAEIPPPRLRLYPIETHVAEKLHAYSLERGRPNSRVKDLPDIALLATIRSLDATVLRTAIDQTFARRDTHPRPLASPEPPPATATVDWVKAYAALAVENDLRWRTLPELLKAVRAFLDPVLAQAAVTRWLPKRWRWE